MRELPQAEADAVQTVSDLHKAGRITHAEKIVLLRGLNPQVADIQSVAIRSDVLMPGESLERLAHRVQGIRPPR